MGNRPHLPPEGAAGGVSRLRVDLAENRLVKAAASMRLRTAGDRNDRNLAFRVVAFGALTGRAGLLVDDQSNVQDAGIGAQTS